MLMRRCSTALAAVVAALVLAIGDAAHAQLPPTSGEAPLDFPGASLFNDQPDFMAGVTVNHADGQYRAGEKLRVRFQAERKAFLYLIYHQADGTSLLLFPNVARPKNRIAAMRSTDIPEKGEAFRFEVGPPLGREVLQVLASVEPLAELEALRTDETALPLVSLEMLTTLAERLNEIPATWTEHRIAIHSSEREAEAPRTKPSRLGLFIGIGEYEHPEFAPTHVELRHSAEVMHRAMLEHGGLDRERTRLVVDREASKAHLEELIARWLPSVSRPDDTVFIYFSGHAGTFDTRDPEELDGQDESLAPWDLHAGPDGTSYQVRLAHYRRASILDDTLARWLQELSGRQVVVILDTCRAGGFASDKRLPRSLLDDEPRRVKDISQLNTVVLSSCAADEQSLFEGTPNQTMWFTYFLAEAVEKLPRPATVEQAHAYARDGLKKLLQERQESRVQEPQLTDNVLLPVILAP